MKLTSEEMRMLKGDYGNGVQRCMDLLVRWGQIFGAQEMVKVHHVHFSSSMPNELLMEMSEGVDIVRTAASIHAAFDPEWFVQKFGVVLQREQARGESVEDDSAFMVRIRRLNEIGFLPTYTCAPYISGILPRPGDILCWTGSSGQVICNSLFNAKCGRESAATSLAAAITGRTPRMGLLVEENRKARVLVRLERDLRPEEFSDADYGALGYYIGERAGTENVVVDGIPRNISFEQERMLLSPLPVSGACTMCHIAGVTPEAATVQQALGNREPIEEIQVGVQEVTETCQKLSNADNDHVNMVVLGCPHLTIREICALASCLTGTRVHPSVRFLIGVSNPIRNLALDSGHAQQIEKAGAVFMNMCVAAATRLIFPKDLPPVVATNSARAAHYIQRMTAGRIKTIYGDMGSCVRAAITGKWVSK